MTNSIGPNGITIDNLTTIIANVAASLQGIYGPTINLDQNSADGQCVGIAAQAAEDILEFIVAVNNGFDPDQAVGVILDQRCAINYIQRQGGTYTIQPIDITVNTTVSLQGLDANFNDPNGTGYTVQDSSGNLFILQNSITLAAGTTSVNFRAQQIGVVDLPIDTINIPVTIIIGVTAVNNGSAAITVGQTQETDAQLRTRRARSPALASNGWLNGLLAAILALTGVTEAELYQNNTSATVNTIPKNSIWLIVAGGSSSDIANTIYNKLSGGCGMKGDVTYDIITASNALFVAKWDVPAPADLYIKFNLKRTVPAYEFAITSIQNYVANNLQYGIGAFADTSEVTVAAIAGIAAQGGGGVPIDVLISSDGINYYDYLAAPTLKSQWTLDPSNVEITVV